MQDTSGLKSFLSNPWIYNYFQILVGSNYWRNWLSSKVLQLKGGEKVVDIGCGPGDIIPFLPRDIHYFGFDISPEYIDAAKKRWGDQATFVIGTPSEMKKQLDSQLCNADLAMCNGVLHHLDDQESRDVLDLASAILRPGGRFVCIEPVRLLHQSWLSKWAMSRDRGQHIREEQAWKLLVSKIFPQYITHITTHLNRIPYTHIVIECYKPLS